MLQNAEPFVLHTVHEWSQVNTASRLVQKHVGVKLCFTVRNKDRKKHQAMNERNEDEMKDTMKNRLQIVALNNITMN
jgi:lysyl-tRNA synthetase class II